MSRRDPWWLALVRWPLWSWGRLVTTVVVALAIGWGVGVGQTWLARGSSPSGTSAGATGATTTGATTASTTPAGGPATAGATTGASPGSAAGTTTTAPAPSSTAADLAPAGAVTAAREFVTAWARPDLAAEPWWQALNPLCTGTFAAQLHQTDPARVPAHRLVGEPVLASTGPAGTAATGSASAGPTVGSQVVLLAPTDAGGVLVTVVLEGAGWLVSDVEPADAPPAASTAVPEASVAGTPAAQQAG